MSRKKTSLEKNVPDQAGENSTLKLIERLTAAPGPSGYETRAALAAGEELAPFATKVKVDKMGSVVAFKKGLSRDGKKILLAAHLDEIGLLITGIEPGGFLRFTQVGGLDARVLLGQEVLLHPVGRYGPDTRIALPGIIGAKPPHFQTPEESSQVIPLEDLYIDLGLDEAAAKARVSIGDLATPRMPLTNLKNDRAAGKAMDNRACIAIMVQALEILSKCHHSWDVYAVATVQEEVSGLGALTSAFEIHPDIGIAIDVTRQRHLRHRQGAHHHRRAQHPPGHRRQIEEGGQARGDPLSDRALRRTNRDRCGGYSDIPRGHPHRPAGPAPALHAHPGGDPGGSGRGALGQIAGPLHPRPGRYKLGMERRLKDLNKK